ncbi:hypothetical protein OIU78_012981 [Salix suchowensis]|nr:hypothetical protein OIU78_012981 [Salix suchowensis]
MIRNGRRRKRIQRGVIETGRGRGRGMERGIETERREKENAKAPGVLIETRVVILMTRKGRKRSIKTGIRIEQQGVRIGTEIETKKGETRRGTKTERRRGIGTKTERRRGIGKKEREEKRERERAKEKDREREREKREREKERDRERRERDREEREREKRERERERRTREREKRRELISDSDDDSKDRDKKRRRRDDDDYKERVREQSISRSNRHKDNSEESPRKTSDEEDSDKNAIKTREEELEQEQKKLDEEMEKRRRRVQEWQELRRRKEETEIEKHGEEANVNEPKTGKTWTLDGESDDEEAPPTGKSETDMDLEENAKPDEDIKDAMVEDTENDIPAPQNEDDAALPIIMSGRDCIGIAKTGSGKTLAFVLPMLRHIKDQPPVEAGEGPIGLVMAPTRELVQQIHSDIKKFGKVLGIRCVPVYGGSGVAQQISELKRGTEIVVCTPGRMIDILCTSGGKITNLRRVTYLVMDEADRMFDMGFEPQITRIVQNIRPDRQTVLFSATFPRQVETLARKVLNKPVEIQDKCDSLFRNLLKFGYPCLSLHGGKDQTDRESTISDFKTNVCNLLIATSVAARGLDVKDLELVINYDVPNHYEDYVHRVGRTGRAGRKGCAITFISEDDVRYAPDLVKALEFSEQVVPQDLKALADGFMAKVNQGLEQAHGTEEDEKRMAAKKAQAKEYGYEDEKSDSEDEDDVVRKSVGDISQQTALAQQIAALAAVSKIPVPAPPISHSVVQLLSNGGLPVSPNPVPVVVPVTGLPFVPNNEGAARAAALAAAMNLQHNLARIQADAMPEHYEAELEINDFPQNARWKVTHKETLGPISDWTGAAITTRGQFFPPGKVPGPGERKLYLFIEGPTEQSVKRAKADLKRVLEDITNQTYQLPGGTQPGKYSVV